MSAYQEEVSVMDAARALAPPRVGGRRQIRAATVLAWVRERLNTTPGRLTLISILVVVGAACVAVIATGAEQARDRAAESARSQTEPLLVQAANLYTALADANATVATNLLSGGLEPPAKRARYEHDLLVASNSLTALTREAGTSASASPALSVVADQLPVYSGLVETARANNRQGFPIGAAYLRQAAALLTSSILPAADRLYATEARRLSDDYRSGTATATLAAFVVAVAASLVLLLLAQRYVARISHRRLNLPMLVGTVALTAILVWGVIGLVAEQNALATAQRHGSDSVEVLSATAVLLSRAQGDQSLTLVNRGTDETDPLDFTAVMHKLAPSHAGGGLIGKASALAHPAGTSGSARQFDADFAAYRAKTAQINNLEDTGQLGTAIDLAPAAGAISDRLSTELIRQIAAAQRRFTRAATDAHSALDGLWLAIPLVTAIAAALCVLGLRRRINEYR
jgi:hypothetical protein